MNIDTKDIAAIILAAGAHPVAAAICVVGAVLIADEICGGDITHSSKSQNPMPQLN